MSLDLSLTIPACASCHAEERRVFDGNITHNLTELWRELHVHDELYECAGKTAKDIVEPVRAAFERLIEDLEGYRKFDAPNGWGKAVHAVAFLYRLMRACEQYPDASIGVWK